MEENISEKSGFMRLAIGTGMTAYGIAHLTRESGSKSLGSFLITAGALKIAEGIFLYCPMKGLINSNVKDAVSSSFSDFMDGNSIMQAFNATYQGGSSQSQGYAAPINSSTQSSNQSNSGGGGKSSSLSGESNFNGYSYGGTPDKTANYGQSQSSNGNNSNSTLGDVVKAAGQVAQTVTSATQTGSAVNAAAQVASTVANTMSGSQGNKTNQNQNQNQNQNSNQNQTQASNQGQNQNKNQNQNKQNNQKSSNSSNSGQSGTNQS